MKGYQLVKNKNWWKIADTSFKTRACTFNKSDTSKCLCLSKAWKHQFNSTTISITWTKMFHCIHMLYQNPLYVVIIVTSVGITFVRPVRMQSSLVNCITWMMLTLNMKWHGINGKWCLEKMETSTLKKPWRGVKPLMHLTMLVKYFHHFYCITL